MTKQKKAKTDAAAPTAGFVTGLKYFVALFAAELQAAGPESMVKALALIATAERTGKAPRRIRPAGASAPTPWEDEWARALAVHRQTQPPLRIETPRGRPREEYMPVGPGEADE